MSVVNRWSCNSFEYIWLQTRREYIPVGSSSASMPHTACNQTYPKELPIRVKQ